MPNRWSRKDERRYEHIKQSETEQGVGLDRAKEIAARTVNKQRRKEGRTLNKQSRGTGNPRRSLDDRSRQELYNLAKELNIPGRSAMNKEELIDAVRDQ